MCAYSSSPRFCCLIKFNLPHYLLIVFDYLLHLISLKIIHYGKIGVYSLLALQAFNRFPGLISQDRVEKYWSLAKLTI